MPVGAGVVEVVDEEAPEARNHPAVDRDADGGDDEVRIRVLGRVTVVDPEADRTLGGGQARELLAFLVARRGRPATTTEIIDTLWAESPPATAATIVHGLVRRIRKAIGSDLLAHDQRGYFLDLRSAVVDLWVLDEALRAGDRAAVRRAWRHPAFGVFATRPWAQVAVEPFAELIDPGDDDTGLLRARRRVPVSRLVGRRRELTSVGSAIRRSRLVTIVGLGGVGKTRLALEVLRELAPEGDVQVDVGAAAGPVGTRVAIDLGLASSGEPDRDLRATASLIGRRPLVLLLDGCEHDLSGSARVVEALLGTCPDLRIIATSRLTLGVPGEHVVPLLPFADPGDPRGDAVELLLDRARSMGLAVTAEDRPRAAEICRRAAGVPLAIELGVSELLLPDGGDDPAARSGDQPAPVSPERAVDEVVRHALAQLSDPTCRAAVRLAHLVSGFTPEMAAAVRPEGASATGILHELVACGLVIADTAGPTRRLRFLDRVRDALREQSAGDDLPAVTLAMVDALGAVRPALDGPVSSTALARAVAELPNAQALLDHLADRGRPVCRLVLATTAADTWAEDGQWAHGATELAAALAEVRPAAADEPRAIPGWTVGAPLAPAPGLAGATEPVPADDLDADAAVPVDPVLWARAVRAWGAVTATYEGARRLMEDLDEAARIAADAGDLALEGHLQLHLANARGYDGDLPRARKHFDRLREIVAELDSPYVRAGTDGLGALSRLVLGDPAGARDGLEAAAERLEQLGALSDAARTRRNLALACRAAGDVEAALAALEHAERLALRAKARGTLATIRTDLADLQVQQGQTGSEVLRSALDAVLAVGNTRAAGLLRTRLGVAEDDPATVALGVLDLWDTDQRWAAPSLATLLGMLPADHELHEHGPAAVAELLQGWGTPLDAREAAIAEPFADAPAPATGDWEELVRSALTHLATTSRRTL